MKKWTLIPAVVLGSALALVSISPASGATPNNKSTSAAAQMTQPEAAADKLAKSPQALEQGAAAIPFVQAPPTYQPSTSEASFVTVPPCRIVDTRRAGGKIPGDSNRSFYVAGTLMFVPQGGTSGGCGIPNGATAIAANVSATQEDGTGYLRAWPAGTAPASNTILNFTKNIGITNGVTLPISTGAGADLTIRSYVAATHVVIDITGYYAKPLAGMISPSGSPYSGTSRIVSASHPATGVYDVVFDRNIRYCAAVASVYVSKYFASTSTFYGGNSNSVRVYLWKLSAGNMVAVDQYFYLSVNC